MIQITICNFKGGQGKSLIAHQLITGFGYKGIEIDPYGSLSDRLPEHVVRIPLDSKSLPKAKGPTLYDFGGFDDVRLDLAVSQSNLVIIPFIPTLESVQGTLETVHRITGMDTPVMFVANMAQKTQDIEDARFVFEEAMGCECPFFTIPLSVALQTAINENRSVIDLASQGGIRSFAYKKASQLIRSLHQTVEELA